MSNYTAETTIASSKEQIMTKNSQTVSGEAPDISAFQQVLLTANGTVTAMLEAHFSEQIQLIKLSEERAKKELKLPNIKLDKEEEVIGRKVLLQGKVSHRNYLYADSFILINNLEERFRDQLLTTDKPIGKLWSEHKVETFKEIIYFGKHPANELSKYFCIEPEDNLFSRTYSVYSQGKINMIITEKFPERCF
ncbi:MAG: chorismate pyruvate-lyase family protein [Calothrix sp. MO_167.B42]|nr:chorismate pyruvate-lyase family protein [Calothrix sp. MO_167.B42]